MTAVADLRSIAVRQPLYEGVRVRRLACSRHLRLASVRRTHTKILGDRRTKNCRILRDKTDRISRPIDVERANVDAIHFDL